MNNNTNKKVLIAQLFGKTQPRYSGYTGWRGIAKFEHELFPSGTTESWGGGRRFGLAPITQRRVFWYATLNVPEGTPDKAIGRKQRLLELFRGWHEPIEAVLEATEEPAILHNDIYDRQPLRHWSKGRVTLLGDAAHPMTPNLGQGACQAIEDAVVLAKCLQESSNVVSAAQLYEKRRIKRANRVVQQSWRIGQIGQLEHPLVCWVRDAMMKSAPSSLQLRQFEWVVGYEI